MFQWQREALKVSHLGQSNHLSIHCYHHQHHNFVEVTYKLATVFQVQKQIILMEGGPRNNFSFVRWFR